MKQIRANVFETNSSSTHSLFIFSESEWEKFKEGKAWLDSYTEKMVFVKPNDEYNDDLIDYDGYCDRADRMEDSFHVEYTTEHGDKVVVVGYYGHNG